MCSIISRKPSKIMLIWHNIYTVFIIVSVVKMNQIDVNYIVEGKVEVFDWLFVKRVGIDGDKNYIYLVEDKFREHRYAKFVNISDPHRIKQHITQLLIFQNSNDSKLIQPIFDFTISKDKRLILVTMPVPPRTLYSVIKDTKVDLRVRLLLVKNLANGGVYMHNRRRSIFGHIRPESIVIHEELNVFQKGRSSKRNLATNSVELYARLNSFSTLIQSQVKAEKWKWQASQLQYYDAPQIWSEIDKKKKNADYQNVQKSQKSMDTKSHVNKYTFKSDVWALGLIFVQILTAMKVSQLLQNNIPGKLLKDLAKQSSKYNLKKNENISQQTEKIQESKQLAIERFYDKLLKSIECFTLRTLIEKMLSYKPEKRPTIEQVLHIVERLETVDKRNKNMGRVISYKKSLKNLKICQQSKVQAKPEESLDDKKSVISMKSMNSGKSNKSYYSQTRKRIQQDFSNLLYARQVITQLHSTPTNPLYRTYFEDCKNRLPSDMNFSLPPKKLTMKKEDKAISLALKGEQDEDINKWNLEKVMGEKTPSAYEQKIMQRAKLQLFGIKSKDEETHQKLKSYKNLLKNYQSEIWPNEQSKTNENGKNEGAKSGFGPQVKKIPNSHTALKEQAYNQNLMNYHYLGVENSKKQQQLSTCLNRKQNFIPDTPQKEVQFILNLKFRNLLAVPFALADQLHAPNCLKYLSLAHNQISSLHNLMYSPQLQQNLMVLDVSWNMLARIDAEFWLFQSLEEVYLMNNIIERITGFVEGGSTGQNQEMICQNAEQEEERQLQKLDSETLGECLRVAPKLRKLYLNTNKVKVLENVLQLNSLQVLSLGQNPLPLNQINVKTIQALRAKGVKFYY